MNCKRQPGIHDAHDPNDTHDKCIDPRLWVGMRLSELDHGTYEQRDDSD